MDTTMEAPGGHVYAVIACSACRSPWLIELRHARVTCPRCAKKVDVARRTRLWQGDDMHQAQAAVATHRAAMAQGTDPAAAMAALEAPRPLVRHDDPLDAAAAKGRAMRNASERAEEVTKWMTRLVGDVAHERLLDALRRAGLDAERAEREIIRMLACDVMFEPKVGHYRHLDA